MSSTDHPPRAPAPDVGDAHDVFLVDEQADVAVDVQRCSALARLVLAEEEVRTSAELSVTFVDELTMQELHERFLGLEGATDVLAFPMDEDLVETGRQPDQGGRGPGTPSEPTELPFVVGDVVVCPVVARRQADERGIDWRREVELLVVHGVLHLLGYDHEDDERAAERMRRRERELLELFDAGAPPAG